MWSLVLVLTLKRTYGLMKADRNEQGQFLEELVNCTLRSQQNRSWILKFPYLK